jgi:hypothetical protein
MQQKTHSNDMGKQVRNRPPIHPPCSSSTTRTATASRRTILHGRAQLALGCHGYFFGGDVEVEDEVEPAVQEAVETGADAGLALKALICDAEGQACGPKVKKKSKRKRA